MSWFLNRHETQSVLPDAPWVGWSGSGSLGHVPLRLGVAEAGRRWQWAEAEPVVDERFQNAEREPERPTILRVPGELVRRMAVAAQTSGRSERDIWAEAARLWLRNHVRDDEPQPPTPAAAALAVPRPSRSWTAVDDLMTQLRRPPNVDQVAQVAQVSTGDSAA